MSNKKQIEKKSAALPEQPAVPAAWDENAIDELFRKAMRLPKQELARKYAQTVAIAISLSDSISRHNQIHGLEHEFSESLRGQVSSLQSAIESQRRISAGWMGQAENYLDELLDHRNSRSRGGIGKTKKNEEARLKAEAKQEANNLWPEALRKGWTARRMHTALTEKGYSISADRVAKWVTALRKTGSC